MESANSLSVDKYEPGAGIVTDNSPREMIVVLRGEAGLYKNYGKKDEVFIRTIGPGNFCCEQTLFLNQGHYYQLIALTDVFALAVTRDNVNNFFTAYPDVAFSIVETIYKKLEDATAILWELNLATEAETPTYSEAPVSPTIYTLFPEGHGSYTLELSNANANIISLTQTICPLCEQKFDTHYILMSKLRRKATDPDMRVRYTDAEPLHYNVVTCPGCLFSAESASFAAVPKKYAEKTNEKLADYKKEVVIKTGNERDTFTVFAGYYLALLCAPLAFDNHELLVAGLWLKLSRLYEDCGDKPMHIYAVKKTLEAYNHVYTNVRINNKQTQQVRFVIGELHFKLGDYDTARQFFYMLKSDNNTPPTMQQPVEARLELIRSMKNPG
jgi:hypothetical protein